MKKTSILTVLSTFIICYVCWLLFTWTFTIEEMLAGAVVSLIIAAFTSRFFIHDKAFYLYNPHRFLALLEYVFYIFPRELWKANMDVAKRALSPKLPISPGIVKVPSKLTTEYELNMLANSITLTPGTITMDIAEIGGINYYYIHWIDVASTDPEKAGDAIKGTLENWIRRIWK